jgi:hypothetical protein
MSIMKKIWKGILAALKWLGRDVFKPPEVENIDVWEELEDARTSMLFGRWYAHRLKKDRVKQPEKESAKKEGEGEGEGL